MLEIKNQETPEGGTPEEETPETPEEEKPEEEKAPLFPEEVPLP